MKPIREEIGQGAYFTYLPMEKFKTCRLTLAFILPLENKTASSYAVLLPLLRRGCRAFPGIRLLERELENLYSTTLYHSIGKLGDREVITVTLEMLREEFTPGGTDLFASAFSLLENVLLDPLLSDDDTSFLIDSVKREQKNARDAVLALKNNKAAYARARCIELMFPNEPYGIAEGGTLKGIDEITPNTLYSAYRKLLSASQIEFLYAGTHSKQKITDILSSFLKRTERSFSGIAETKPHQGRLISRSIREKTESSQSKLHMGFSSRIPIKAEELAAFQLFTAVFGGTPTSKLFVHVRERMSLCYSCYAGGNSMKSVLFVSAGIERKNKRRAVKEILRQLALMKKGNMTEHEIETARSLLIYQYETVSDDPQKLISWYLTNAISGKGTTPEEEIAAIKRVTAKELREMAARFRRDTLFFLDGIGEETQQEEAE